MVSTTTQAQALRQRIEAELAGSFAGALTPRICTERPALPFGIEALDQAAGGVPVGAVTELTGAGSTGKTGVAMQIAAGAMRSGKVCAWVDASDSFDPATGEANGMVLAQLLWVRCGGQPRPAANGGRGMMAAGTVSGNQDRVHGVARGHCGSHPRAEERGLDRAVSHLFQTGTQANRDTGAPGCQNPQAAGFPAVRAGSAAPAQGNDPAWPDGSRTGMHSTRNRQTVGTPGAPNAPLSPSKRAPFEPCPEFRPVKRSEQVASDRQGGRNLQQNRPEPARPQPDSAAPRVHGGMADSPRTDSGDPLAGAGSPRPVPEAKPWARLDQALRAADLLLQGGGFAVLVLDLGSIAPEHVGRIPAATWFRFRAVAEANGMVFVLLSQAPCARSSAALVVQFSSAGFVLAGGTVVESVRYRAEIARQRFAQGARKGPMATWQASPYRRPEHLRPAAQRTDREIPHGAPGTSQPVPTLAPVLPWRTAGQEESVHAPEAR